MTAESNRPHNLCDRMPLSHYTQKLMFVDNFEKTTGDYESEMCYKNWII